MDNKFKAFLKQNLGLIINKFEFDLAGKLVQYGTDEKIARLKSGLDAAGADAVDTVLKRAQSLARNYRTLLGQKYIPINEVLSRDEVAELKTIRLHYKNNIKKIAGDKYLCNGYYLPVPEFEISLFHYKYNLDKVKDINRIRKGNIIDAGGFVGDSALLLSGYTAQKVYTFEPIQEHFNCIQKTIDYNKLTNVVPVNLGLGAECNELEFTVSGGGSGYVANLNKGGQTVMAKVDTLDNYVDKHHLNVSLIKSDIEGAEQDLLAGARKTIETQKPTLIISIYHSAEDFFDIKPLIESWNLGYNFTIVKSLDPYMLVETLLIAESS